MVVPGSAHDKVSQVMSTSNLVPETSVTRGLTSEIPGPALRRATGASRVDGNALRLQFDGPYTFDAWIEAIDRAEKYIHFENYILRDDRVGRVFRDALVQKAKEGVQVRVLYDWMGSWATRKRYWKPFGEAGAEVRAFNPPSIRDPFGVSAAGPPKGGMCRWPGGVHRRVLCGGRVGWGWEEPALERHGSRDPGAGGCRLLPSLREDLGPDRGAGGRRGSRGPCRCPIGRRHPRVDHRRGAMALPRLP